MPRPNFAPTDEQRATLDALARLARRRKKLDAEADQLMSKADEQGIPISRIAQAADVQRKTVYRHLGKPMK